MLGWAQTTHGDVLAELLHGFDARFRLRPTETDAELQVTWAMSDGVLDDGEPPLARRYAMRPDLPEQDRRIAERIAAARACLCKVHAVVPGAWAEIEALDGSATRQRVVSAGISSCLQPGLLVLARLMDSDGVTTFWGPAVRYPAEDERKWRAFLRVHDLATVTGSLAALTFVPEDHAEPIADGVRLLENEWGIDDIDEACDELADSPQAADLGLEVCEDEDVWAFAWLGPAHPEPSVQPEPSVHSEPGDLGGWREDPERIEVARLRVYPSRLCAISASSAVLAEIEAWATERLPDLTPTLFRAV